ncbi:lytic transglycosylase domain-containing protein [Hydrocarboniclastica marina]|uniref:Lytic transglycosylase domain-containing protein n=1 Tax=Hydrocarboniclastica marina TaxID=2259620 RepID=A0A4P7XLF3_9ALTE|nr:lytic transglycosylase domain-containing protein [Hydrocarboniclastica marina]QCF28086.1 lytic transglycosylase domain-containing protein [Hydrocarboniclastica marina]
MTSSIYCRAWIRFTFILTALFANTVAQAEPYLSLGGTVYESAAVNAEIDPYLLYALTLVESGKATGDGNVIPWPYVIRAKDARIYASDEAEYRAAWKLFSLKYGDRIDVGPAQVNVYWQATRAKKVTSPDELLDYETNLNVAAEVLKEAIDSTDNLALGIGRYHSWGDQERALLFGKRVLAVHQNLVAQTGAIPATNLKPLE